MTRGFDCLNEWRIEAGQLVLTEDQKELAHKMAQCRLLEDPAVCARLRQLQAEAMVDVLEMVKNKNCILSDGGTC